MPCPNLKFVVSCRIMAYMDVQPSFFMNCSQVSMYLPVVIELARVEFGSICIMQHPKNHCFPSHFLRAKQNKIPALNGCKYRPEKCVVKAR